MARRIILREITELSMCEVFVFGSNLEGEHYGGAARTAYEKFGAEWGVGAGPSGKSYAIPTMHGGVKDIKPYVDEFIEYARNHPNNRFLLTRIGCGIAGFKDKQIAPLFKEAWRLPNVCFPKEWYPIVNSDQFIDAVMFGVLPKEKTVKIPKAITERDLSRLCEQYKYIIGSGVKATLPKIRVRYVLDNGRFGYSDFGDFFINELGMYVWTRNKEFIQTHNQGLVEDFFGDECYGRGFFHRVLFAGVETPFRDSKGDRIFTGDVIHVEDRDMKLALGTLGENLEEYPDSQARYAFVLDNHFLAPEDSRKMTRIGTVFYQLDWGDDMTVAQRCWDFQGCYPGAIPLKDRLVLAKYTPNFDKELWKYRALETLEIEEFNWRKHEINNTNKIKNQTMFKSKIKYASQVKGVIGEMHLTIQLLLLGHDVANTNFTVKNTAYYDLLCRKDGEGKAYPIQVKTSFSYSFRVGMTHGDFMDANGNFDEAKGRKRAEEKVQCSWAFVECDGTETEPNFRIYILTREQVIDMIVASEYWYLTNCGKEKPHVKSTGDIGLLPMWLRGESGKATTMHSNIFPNPLKGVSQENNWDNIWK